MAYISVTRTATHAGRILSIKAQIQQLRENIDSLIAEITEMLSGAADQEASFASAGTHLGVTTAEAKSIFDKLFAAKALIDGQANPSLVQLAIQIG